jgi:hypothetical protein
LFSEICPIRFKSTAIGQRNQQAINIALWAMYLAQASSYQGGSIKAKSPGMIIHTEASN